MGYRVCSVGREAEGSGEQGVQCGRGGRRVGRTLSLVFLVVFIMLLVYIYIYIYGVYVYIYIYRERES